MANTERFAALQRVRAAEKAVDGALALPGVSDEDRSVLTKLEFTLEQLEDSLILDDITSQVASIRDAASKLTETVGDIDKASAQISSTLSVVEQAAEAVGALADIVSLASSHGLLG
jgi:hypothetical protein